MPGSLKQALPTLLLLILPRLAPPQPTPPPAGDTLTVAVSLSPQATARLAQGEGLVVYASFEADPAPGARKHADETGRIDLGHQQAELPGRPGTATLPVPTARMPLRWTRGPINLNVNVFSARHTSPDNLLSCDFFDGPLPHGLALHPIPLHCSLITEKQPTRALS